MTASEWKKQNPTLKGNIRDHATIHQLVVLTNLESLNAEYIKQGLPQKERLEKLNHTAISQMMSLVDNKTVKKLENK